MQMSRVTLPGVLMLLAGSLSWAQVPTTWTEPTSGIEFVKIGKGCFQMGAAQASRNNPEQGPAVPMPDEVPRHEVCVDGFWIGKFEVTRAQWQRVMSPGAREAGHPQRPMLKIAPEDAKQFLQRLNAQAGDRDGAYRLPTEAEWEYACRAGQAPDDHAELSPDVDAINRLKTVAWYQELSSDAYDLETLNAGEMAANAWGLHDMLGNALELVQDDYDENAYRRHARMNPTISGDGSRYVLRGGSFKSEWWHVRCGARMFGIAGGRLETVGLRIVRTVKARK
jgi:formylglycine-generating enzyme